MPGGFPEPEPTLEQPLEALGGRLAALADLERRDDRDSSQVLNNEQVSSNLPNNEESDKKRDENEYSDSDHVNDSQINDGQVKENQSISNRQVVEPLAIQFAQSSLSVALPDEGNTKGQTKQASLVYNSLQSPISLHSRLPPDTLPFQAEAAIKNQIANYMTWDQRIYDDLPLDPDSIRLIEIRPGVSSHIEVDLVKRSFDETKNAYEALSYTWGSPELKKVITVYAGQIRVEVQINKRLFDAISSLRLPATKRCLWVDAICMNQSSLAERSIEVQKMGEIYRLAKKVVVFLGSPSRTTQHASCITELFKFLSRPDHGDVSQNKLSNANGKAADLFRHCGFEQATICNGFIALCCRPWWRRVWTLQEFYLAIEEPVWYWGNTGVDNTVLKRDMPLLMASSIELLGNENIDSWIPEHIKASTGKSLAQFGAEIRRLADLITRRSKTHGYDIPSRLYRSLTAKATDPRDLVYGLREIFDPVFRKVFVPDYFMRLELLYACLAVFLIQCEGWGDMLWWYPYRFQGDKLPSWLPDFTRRVAPVETELLPRDHLASSTLQLKLVVLNHTLHVEGYQLDTIECLTPPMTGGERDILRELWKFDGNFERRRHHLKALSTLNVDEQECPSVTAFLKSCSTLFESDTPALNHPQLSILNWVMKRDGGNSIPCTVVECLRSWDILEWHAYRTGTETVCKHLDWLGTDWMGFLKDFVSPHLSVKFRQILVTDLIADCVFSWSALNDALERLETASPWSDPTHPFWQTSDTTSTFDQNRRARDLGVCMISFLATHADSVGDPHRFYALFCLLLFESSTHVDFKHRLDVLKFTTEKLYDLSLNSDIQAQTDDLVTKVDIVATRVRNSAAVCAHFSGRSLFWTKRGFYGLTCPGVEVCEGDEVMLLDGLSFPMVVRGFDEKEGRGKLVGCATVKGIDLLNQAGGIPSVPEGFVLGKKRLFRFS